MKTRDKILIIALLLLVFGWSIYMIRSILAPFILSLVLAYFLHPLVDKLCQKIKISRLSAILLIVGLFFLISALIASFVVPIIYKQFSALILALPQYIQIFALEIYPKIFTLLESAGIPLNSKLQEVISNPDITASIFDVFKKFAGNLITSSIALINLFSLIFIMPILIFYLLKDWNLLVERVYSYLPKQYNLAIRKIFSEIDQALSGFIRGQINVCLILSVIYSISLTFTGLNFGFLIGIFTGLLSFIPYVGAVSGVVAALIVAFFQWGLDFMNIFFVILAFIFGQIIETNFLTPKLVGNKIGVHPVWVIFGIFVFGSLFGFLGVAFATPLTAIAAVLIRHLALEYKKRIS